jgi:mannose-6-phosphate isomerase-like protein (cupin superfamily)
MRIKISNSCYLHNKIIDKKPKKSKIRRFAVENAVLGEKMGFPEKVLVIELNNKPENQRLLSGSPQTSGMRSGRVHLAPDQACGQHSTKDREELLVFLSGRGKLLIGENESFDIGRGKVSYIPPNTIHDVKNTGSDPLIYVYCVAPVSGE